MVLGGILPVVLDMGDETIEAVRRVSIVGVSGSGKTTLARALAAAMAVRHVELDAIFHQPGWTELPEADFRLRVAQELAAEGWVIDGNYMAVRDLVWAAADTVVWLDVPRRTVMRRLIRRTATRAVTRRELWNGNREPVTAMFRRDPAVNIVRWAWINHGTYRDRYDAATIDPAYSHLKFVRLATDDDVGVLLHSVVAAAHDVE